MTLPQIIDGILNNDRSCQRALYYQYAQELHHVCRRYLRPGSLDSQDILQEAFIQIFRSIALYDPRKGKFESWLKTITIRTALKAYRKKQPIYESIDKCANTTTGLSGYDFLLEQDVMNVVNRLPDDYRQVFILFVVDEYSHKEISDLLEININTSRSKLKRARDLLKNYLKRSENLAHYAAK